ncbi:MAG: transposase [Anaerolineae bacterium]|nr:transposase [Anaerolineae bacterium]
MGEKLRYDPDKHHRRSIRLKGYDYASPGAYYVTICTYQKECFLSTIIEDNVALSPCGELVQSTWKGLPKHYNHVQLDAFVIMPNHLHAVIVLIDESQPTSDRVGASVGAGFKPAHLGMDVEPAHNHNPGMGVEPAHSQSPGVGAGLKPAPTKRHTLSEIVRAFKTSSARRINALRNISGVPVWQRNYYERIVRDEDELNRIRQYIGDNPARWAEDSYYPEQDML